MSPTVLSLVFHLGLIAVASPDGPVVIVADFESADYGAWKTTGTAFGKGPAKGTLPGQMSVSGFEGKGLVNSFLGGDDATGTLESPQFELLRPYLNFLIGGGKDAGKLRVELVVDGKVVRSATGPNDQPGGSEALEPDSWDVREFAGKRARIRIVDDKKGGWGHINVDQIVQSDRQVKLAPVERMLALDKDWLVLPVRTGARKERVALKVDGKIVREFDIELEDDAASAQFLATLDVRPWMGKEGTLVVAKSSRADLFKSVRLSGGPPPTPMPGEKGRPEIHFTSNRGWLNDPNGLVYLDGEWHLYYQHNPYGWSWGNMHWGHAVSKDLLHWEELGEALYPRAYGDWAFSGSAVVDKENTSGWQSGKTPLMVLAYTSTGRGECISYSNDKGRTWTEYEGNPVVKHQGRDPRLIWHQPTNSWVMAVYDEAEGKRWIAFHTSPDLKTWTYQSRIEGFFECPDLFKIKSRDNPSISRWVLYAADGEYILGQFDGKAFVPDSPKKQRLWYGNFYAAQTYSNAPEGRRIQIGWANGITFPEKPFNQQMTIPVEMTLRGRPDSLSLYAVPVREADPRLKPHRGRRNEIPKSSEKEIYIDAQWCPSEVRMTIDSSVDAVMEMDYAGAKIRWDRPAGKLQVGKVEVPLRIMDELHVIRDVGSVEAFIDGGRIAVSAAIPGEPRPGALKILVEKGTVRIPQSSSYRIR